jgi:hypothetical protein
LSSSEQTLYQTFPSSLAHISHHSLHYMWPCHSVESSRTLTEPMSAALGWTYKIFLWITLQVLSYSLWSKKARYGCHTWFTVMETEHEKTLHHWTAHQVRNTDFWVCKP